MKILSSLLLLSILLQGCTSIEQPVASRALVEYELGGSVVHLPANQQQILSDSADTQSTQLDGKRVVLGKPFFAASGKICRKVQFKLDGQRVYCKTHKGEWYAVNQVLASYTESTMGGNQ